MDHVSLLRRFTLSIRKWAEKTGVESIGLSRRGEKEEEGERVQGLAWRRGDRVWKRRELKELT